MTNSPLRAINSEFYNMYYDPIEALKANKTKQEVIDLYIERQKKEEPIDFYINYVRYLNKVVVIFDKKSVFGKMVLLLNKGDSARGFISCEIDNLPDLIKVHMSLLDLVKLHLMVKLKVQFGLNDKQLQFIFLALRYDVNVVPMGQKGKMTADIYWLMRDITMYKLWNDLDGKRQVDVDKMPKEVKATYEKIKESGAYTTIKYRETDNFERLMYYALNYRKSAFLSIGLHQTFRPITYFVNGSDIGNLGDGITINLLRLLLRQEIIRWDENPSGDIVREETMSHMGGEQKKKKEKYIEGLYKKVAKVGIDKMGKTIDPNEDTEQAYNEFRRLTAEIDKAEIELRFGFFDFEGGDEQVEYPDWIKDVEKFLEFGANGEYTLEIHKGKVDKATNRFTSTEISKEEYQKLRDYVAGYGHVAPDENVGIVTRYVGEKRHRYGKKEADN